MAAPDFPPAMPGRILAVRGGALGDFILTLPALQSMGRAGHQVELLTRPAYGRLAQEAGLVSGWRALDAPEAGSLTVSGAPILPAWRDWLRGFSAVVSWVPDPDGAFREQILNAGVAEFHQADWRCAGAGPAACQLASGVPWLVNPANDFAGEALFPGLAMPRQNPDIIGFHPGSGSTRKNWPPGNWIDVMVKIRQLHPRINWRVITGEAETGRLGAIYQAMDDVGLLWEPWHELELTRLARLLKGCRGFLGHDSGVSHLAAACGVSCRLLFGPTDPAVWAPLGDHVRTLSAGESGWDGLTPAQVVQWLDGWFC